MRSGWLGSIKESARDLALFPSGTGHWAPVGGSAGPLGGSAGPLGGSAGPILEAGHHQGPARETSTHTTHTGQETTGHSSRPIIHDANEGRLKGFRNNLELNNIWHKVQWKGPPFWETVFSGYIGLAEASSQTGCLPLKAPWTYLTKAILT